MLSIDSRNLLGRALPAAALAVTLALSNGAAQASAQIDLQPGAGFADLSAAVPGGIPTPSLAGIYDQPAFGAHPITIRWLSPGATITNPALATVADQSALQRIARDTWGPPTVYAYYVEDIRYCDGAGSYVGCSTGSNIMVLKSSTMSSNWGAIDLAHELGHLLGLSHVPGTGNLMNPLLNSTALTSAQVATMLSNKTILQQIGNSLYIDIQPIIVQSSAPVPEPQTYAMLLAGLAFVGGALRRGGTRRDA